MLKKSASLIVIKPCSKFQSYSVLMVKRANVGSFKSAYVFPGGNLEAIDSDKELINLDLGTSKYRTKLSDQFIPYELAAIRETFEETGVLVCSEKQNTQEQVNEWRQKISNQQNWNKLILTNSLGKLDLKQLKYVAEWITPLKYPKRFQTKFFITILSPEFNILPIVDNKEVMETKWVQPDELLNEYNQHQGKILLFPPQYYILNTLKSKFDNFDKLKSWFDKFPLTHSNLLNYNNNNITSITTKKVTPFLPQVINITYKDNHRVEHFCLSKQYNLGFDATFLNDFKGLQMHHIQLSNQLNFENPFSVEWNINKL